MKRQTGFSQNSLNEGRTVWPFLTESTSISLTAPLIPLSRGTPPEEFTLRIACEPSTQLSLGGPQNGECIELGGQDVHASIDGNGYLLLVAKGIQSKDQGHQLFEKLRRIVAHAGINNRLAVAMPAILNEAKPWGPAFFPDDERALAHGWPAGRLPPPLAIENIGAWLYAEHEYVVLLSCISFTPIFQTSIASVTEALTAANQIHRVPTPLPPEVALAATFFAYATRSTMSVWRLLLVVTCLEMLASRARVDAGTLEALRHLAVELRNRFSKSDSAVDFEHLDSCLKNAKRQSIAAAVRNLIVAHCAPGANMINPLTSIFIDEEDCRRKVSALYALRSQYSHDGRISAPKDLKGFSWWDLQHIAEESLRHILNNLLNGKRPDENEQALERLARLGSGTA